MTDNDSTDKTAEEYENEYAGLTPKQKSGVDSLAERGQNETMKEVAERAGVSESYLYYVEDNFGGLVDYRESAMRYATDGSGEAEYVDVRLTEDEAFKAIRMLPQELSQVVYQAVRSEK